MPTAQATNTELLFPESAVRELVTSAVDLARRTTERNVCNAACVQWTMEDRYDERGWHSTLEPGSDSSDDAPFTEDEVRGLVTEAVSFARRFTPENMSDEACEQRIMKDRFIDGLWQSTLRS